MKHGDLSNQTSPRVLIDFDTLVIEEKKLNVLERTKLILKGEDLQRYTFDGFKIHYLYRLIKHTNISITLVTTNPRLLRGYNADPLLPCDLKYVGLKDNLKELLYTIYSYDCFVTNDNTMNWEDLPRHLQIFSFNDFLEKFGVR